MAHTYSIAEARDNLAKIVRESESGPVELTRRGRPVAVLVSLDEFERLQGRGENFWQRLVAFRRLADMERFGIDENVFDGVRDRDAGRKAPW
ncbi:MAG: type II toxin-antitoxin system Phd/YefM family antitoxin [Blastocatellia bacterium]|jgi:prevent-host-death family protein|nr:type II toxin-antitoxin system Phd/YefM family antitoxin [Blastocatellia bacterium]MBK6426613.1 type II toxin-antitoxin system Phd/YefM family antitoxin [Blastocatellia bacterium]